MEVENVPTQEVPQQRIDPEGILECQVCYDYFSHAIYQCADGHVICQSCYGQLQYPRVCPSCKGSYPPIPIRNRAVERIATQAVALGLVDNPNQANPITPPGQGVKRPAPGAHGARIASARHHGIFCDGHCPRTHPIMGPRYKCAECANLDLCEDCAKDGLHGHHLLIRIGNPASANKVEDAVTKWRNRTRDAELVAAIPAVSNDVQNAPTMVANLDDAMDLGATDEEDQDRDEEHEVDDDIIDGLLAEILAEGPNDDEGPDSRDDASEEQTAAVAPQQFPDIATPEPSFYPRYTYEPRPVTTTPDAGNTDEDI